MKKSKQLQCLTAPHRSASNGSFLPLLAAFALTLLTPSARAETEVVFKPSQFLLYTDSMSAEVLQLSTDEIESRQRKGEAYGLKRSPVETINQYIRDLHQGTLSTITQQAASEYCSLQTCGTSPCKLAKSTVLSEPATRPDPTLAVQGYELAWSQVKGEILIHEVLNRSLNTSYSYENLTGTYLRQVTCTDTSSYSPPQSTSMELHWKSDLPKKALSWQRTPEINWVGSLSKDAPHTTQETAHSGELTFPSALFFRQSTAPGKAKQGEASRTTPVRRKYSRRPYSIWSCPCDVCPSNERRRFSRDVAQKTKELISKREATGLDTLTYLGVGANRAGFDLELLDGIQNRIAKSEGIKNLVVVLLDPVYSVKGTFINEDDRRMNSPPQMTWIEDVFPAVVERLLEQANRWDHPLSITLVAYDSWTDYAADINLGMALRPNVVTAVDTYGTKIDSAVQAMALPGLVGQLEGGFFQPGSKWSYASESHCKENYKRVELLEALEVPGAPGLVTTPPLASIDSK